MPLISSAIVMAALLAIRRFVPSIVDQGFSFDGMGDYVEVAHSASLNLSEFSVEAWVYIDLVQSAGEFNVMVSKSDGSSASGGFILAYDARSIPGIPSTFDALDFEALGGPRIESNPFLQNAFPVSGYYHVAGTFDGSVARLYLNGALVSTGLPISSVMFNSLTLRIGGAHHASIDDRFEGIVDEVSIFDRELMASEIQAIFAAGSGGKCKSASNCRRVVASDTVAASATQTGTAPCMSGEAAVGGGFSLGSSALVIHATQPTSSMDGWENVIENTDNSNAHGFDVTAVCCPATCTRVVVSDTVAASATQTGTAPCVGGDAAVGGGFSLGSNALVIHATQPTSSMGGWENVIENTDNSNAHGFDVTAVCCPATCTRVVVSDTVAASATQTGTASCMSGETAVGGGFSLGSNALVIHATQPASSMDGWEGVVENTDNSNAHGFDVIAVCCIEPVPVELQSFSVE